MKVFFLLSLLVLAFSSELDPWREIASTRHSIILSKWLSQCSVCILSGEKIPACPLTLPPADCGIFVTIIKSGRIRGCYGSFLHSSVRSDEVIVQYLRAALRSDRRYSPLSVSEAADAFYVITAAARPFCIDSVDDIDLAEYGVLAETSGGVYYAVVPSEKKNTQELKAYLDSLNAGRVSAFNAVSVTRAR